MRALIASPLVVVMLIGTRLIIVSDYNTETAVTLLRSGGTLDTVLGSVIPLLPLLLPSVFVVLLILRQWYGAAVAAACSFLVATLSPSYSTFSTIPGQARDRFLWFTLGAGDALERATPLGYQVSRLYGWVTGKFPENVQSILSPEALAEHERASNIAELWAREPLLVLIAAATVLLTVGSVQVDIVSGSVAADFRPNRLFLLDSFFAFLRRLAIGVTLATVVIYAFSFASSIYPIPPRDAHVWSESLRRMWQPPERILLTSGSEEVGYPLGVKDNWQILLTEKGRGIQYLRPDTVRSRTVCDLGSPPRPSPFWGSADTEPTRYPLCFPGEAEPTAPGHTTTPPEIPRPSPTPTVPSRLGIHAR